MQYGTDNDIWIGIYDKPYCNKRIHVRCSCYGGMCSYEFNKFYQEEDIENELDLKTQEELLKTINMLIDEGILVKKMDEKKVREAIELTKREIKIVEDFGNYGYIFKKRRKNT